MNGRQPLTVEVPMRIRRQLVGGVAIAVLFAVVGCTRSDGAESDTAKALAAAMPSAVAAHNEVKVKVKCTDAEMSVTIRPRIVYIQRDKKGKFELETGSEAQEMEIFRPTASAPWPFPGNSYKAQSGGSVETGAVNATVPDSARFKYGIRAVCPSSKGAADTIVIDPELIIVGIDGGELLDSTKSDSSK